MENKKMLDEFMDMPRSVSIKLAKLTDVVRAIHKSMRSCNVSTDKKKLIWEQIGTLAAVYSASCLEAANCDFDYKIKGEALGPDEFDSLTVLSTQDKLNMALDDERYEDAAKLKQRIDSRGGQQK